MPSLLQLPELLLHPLVVREHPLLVPEGLVVIALAYPHAHPQVEELVVDDEVEAFLGNVQRIQSRSDGYHPVHGIACSQPPDRPAFRPGDIGVLEVVGIQQPRIQEPLSGVRQAAVFPLRGALEKPALLQEQRPLRQDELVGLDVRLEDLRTIAPFPVQHEAEHVLYDLLRGVLQVAGYREADPPVGHRPAIERGPYVPEFVLHVPVGFHHALLGFLGTTRSFCFCLICMECSALTSFPLRSFLQWYIMVATVEGVGVKTCTCSGFVFRTLWQ